MKTTSDTAMVTIERIVAGGFGLARLEGRVLLVPLTAPGDRVEVVLPERGSRARLISVVEPGPDRIEPPCCHYGQCGGCDLMHVAYPAQVRAKQAYVEETISRIGGNDLLISAQGIEIVPNPSPLASRIRATWQPTGSGRAGYYRRGSHDVIEIRDCPVLDPELEKLRRSLRIATRTTGLTDGSAVSLTDPGTEATEVEFEIAGEKIRTTAYAFFQANAALIDTFARYVVELTAQGAPARVLELYSGVGLFTVPLARVVGRVEAIESSPIAVELARENVQRADLQNVQIHLASAEQFLAGFESAGWQPDAILVDPPRAGLSEQVLNAVVAIAPGRLVYVSCDPATFARDARRLADAGFRLRGIKAFDLFPQTHHVELVTEFEGANSVSDSAPATIH